MIVIICSARSGSTSFGKYLSEYHNLDFRPNWHIGGPAIYRYMIHRITYDEACDFVLDHNVYLLDRRNKNEQAESLAFRKKKYGNDFFKYHTREVYDIWDEDYKNECKKEFIEHSETIQRIRDDSGKEIIFYEDLFKDTNILKKLDIFDKDLYNKYINPINRNRLFKKWIL